MYEKILLLVWTTTKAKNIVSDAEKNFQKNFVAIVFDANGARQLYWLPVQEVALKIREQTEYDFDYAASIAAVVPLENKDLKFIQPKQDKIMHDERNAWLQKIKPPHFTQRQTPRCR